MEYLQFIRADQDPTHKVRRSSAQARVARERLGGEPLPRKLQIAASPAPRHPTSPAVTPVKYPTSETSNRRINGEITRSSPTRRTLQYATTDCDTSQFAKRAACINDAVSEDFVPHDEIGAPQLPSLIVDDKDDGGDNIRDVSSKFCEHISNADLTWFRIVTWGLTHELVDVDDSVSGLLSQAGRNNARQEGHLIEQWQEMVQWAVHQMNFVNVAGATGRVWDEVDRCWGAVQSLAKCAAEAQQQVAALLPDQRAASALHSPHVSPSSRQHDHQSAMSVSDIAGLALEFSEQKRRSPRQRTPQRRGWSEGISAPSSPHRAVKAGFDSLGFRQPREIGRQVVPNRTMLEVTCTPVGEEEPSLRSTFHAWREQQEICGSIAACCATFSQQWEQSLLARTGDTIAYYQTMLHALNDIYFVLYSSTRKDGVPPPSSEVVNV